MSELLSQTFSKAPPLPFRVLAWPLCFLDQVNSTNRCALEHRQEGVVFVAESQSGGRGRLGRRWHSAPGLGLWLSVGLNGTPQGLTFAAALAVRDTLSPYANVDVKWPNDLYHDGKKMGGILVEHRDNRSALGIGINLCHSREDFPPELQDTAVSLYMAAGKMPDRADVLKNLLIRMDMYLEELQTGAYARIRTEWAEACNMVGKCVCRGDIRGTVSAVDDDGALLVTTPCGTRRIVTADFTMEEKPY